MNPTLGTVHGKPLAIDVARLLDSRLLIQGTSGSGKSHLLRLIVEQVEKHAQCIVVDPEGEYATLREKFPFLLFGPGGEVTNLSPKSAPTAARTALQVGKSVVVDLSEMKGRDHVEFVTRFNAGLLDAPRTLRHPTILVLEEAQLFAPEGGEKESTLSALPSRSWQTALQTIVDQVAPVSTEQLAELLGVHPRGGSYLRTLSRLRAMGLIPERGPIELTAGASR